LVCANPILFFHSDALDEVIYGLLDAVKLLFGGGEDGADVGQLAY